MRKRETLLDELTAVQAAELFRLDPCEAGALGETRRVILASADGILQAVCCQLARLPGASNFLGDAERLDRFRSGLHRWLKEMLRGKDARVCEAAIKNLGVSHAKLGVPGSYVTAAFGLLQDLCIEAILKESAAGRMNQDAAALAVKVLAKRLAVEQVGMLSAYARHARGQLELQRSALEEIVQTRADRLRSTVSLSQAIADEIDETQVVTSLAQHVMTTFQPDYLAIHIVQGGDLVDTPVVIVGGRRVEADGEAMIRLRDNWQLCRAARTGHTFHVADAGGALVKCPYQEFPLASGSYCCIPLAGGIRVCGWMHIARKAPNAFSDDDLEVLGIYGQMVGTAITSLRLVKENRNQATTDALTGLYNRRYFQSVLEREQMLLRRRGDCVSVLMIDVDRFKEFNDLFGHETGDRVLKALAERLRQCVRGGDEVARWGGDEFVILLRNCRAEDAGRIAGKIIREVDAAAVRVDSTQQAHMGICVGVACCPEHAGEMAETMQLADAALRKAKAAGPNRYVVYRGKSPGAPQRLRSRQAPAEPAPAPLAKNPA